MAPISFLLQLRIAFPIDNFGRNAIFDNIRLFCGLRISTKMDRTSVHDNSSSNGNQGTSNSGSSNLKENVSVPSTNNIIHRHSAGLQKLPVRNLVGVGAPHLRAHLHVSSPSDNLSPLSQRLMAVRSEGALQKGYFF